MVTAYDLDFGFGQAGVYGRGQIFERRMTNLDNSVEITSQEQFENWLEQQPAEICQAIACRASLRSLPAAMHLLDQKDVNQRDQMLLLACFRATLLSGVASAWPTPDKSAVKEAARSANFAARSAAATATAHSPARAAAYSAVRSADSAADTAAYSDADSATHSAAHSADSAAHSAADSSARSAAHSATLSAAHSDAALSVTQMIHTQLWPDTTGVGHLLEYWQRFQKIAVTDPIWRFWAEWYQGMFNGKPLDWELQRRVALIDDAIWEQGPEAVAMEIARIRALFDLEQEIAQLKAQLPVAQFTTQPPQIGDNGGPPLDEAFVQKARTDLRTLWTYVEELEEEIAQPEPSPSRISKIAQALWDLSIKIAAYCGSVADGMIREGSKELAKAGAKWAAGGITVTAVAQTEGVQSVAKAAWAFAKALGGG